MSRPKFRYVDVGDGWRWECARCGGYSTKFPTEQEARASSRVDHDECRPGLPRDDTPEPPDVACAVVHTDAQGNRIPCPGYPHADEGHPEPPSDEELNSALPVRPDPRQPAYDAVYEYIRALGGYLPPDPVHRNAVIWRAVHAALGATPVGRCSSSHCVEGDHILPVEEAP